MQRGTSNPRGRFVYEQCLGMGATGVVYRARDTRRNTPVAIKALTRTDPGSLFRFKREFRELAMLAHPNLLQLHELITVGDEWFLSMELIDGGDFLAYVRPGIRDQEATPLRQRWTLPKLEDLVETDGVSCDALGNAQRTPPIPDVSMRSRQRTLDGRLDEHRLRRTLRQLCEGVHALHASGRVHRDLKPSNVLVCEADGRVVVCDFGLIIEASRTERPGPLHRVAGDRTDPRGVKGVFDAIAGTVPYMSPEQSTTRNLTAASDWYSVGVMLYEALTGKLPYSRDMTMRRALEYKLKEIPPCPALVDPSAPRDLSDLAMDLMIPAAQQRPTFPEIMRRLDSATVVTAEQEAPDELFVGRAAELAELENSWAGVGSGRAGLVIVSGRSGMGKSALGRHFLDRVAGAGALVLTGRCYEREELPFKAFDQLVDGLAAHLATLEGGEVRELLPDDAQPLAQIFPVLRQVCAFADTWASGRVVDPVQQRSRAFSALRTLLVRLSERQRLVLYIDDLQWSDLDSAQMLIELLRFPDSPAMLVVCACRSEDEERNPVLSLLCEAAHDLPELVRIDVGPLSGSESLRLASALLGSDASNGAETAAREAHGNPFFLREVATFIRTHGLQVAEELGLDGPLEARIRSLPDEGRKLLSAIAIAGRPEQNDVIAAAAGLGDEHLRALRFLEAQRLVRSTGIDPDDRIEPYHDRIREAAHRILTVVERKALHGSMARSLERKRVRDFEALLEHWRETGEARTAGEYALLAAERAEATLAFARAARLYREALGLVGPERDARIIKEHLGRALASDAVQVAAREVLLPYGCFKLVGHPRVSASQTTLSELNAFMTFWGDVSGQLRVGMRCEDAQRLYGRMFPDFPAPTLDRAEDLTGELCNQLLGRINAAMAAYGLTIRHRTPILLRSRGARSEMRYPGRRPPLLAEFADDEASIVLEYYLDGLAPGQLERDVPVEVLGLGEVHYV